MVSTFIFSLLVFSSLTLHIILIFYREALDHSDTMPITRSLSPVPSIRTVPSIRSRTSTGTQSTMYTAPPAIETLPSIPSRSSSLRSVTDHRSSTHLLPPGTRASDDGSGSISGGSDFQGGGALSRSSSLRRTTSFDDLTRDFTSAVSRATTSLGVTNASPGQPVTISSGATSRGQENVGLTPPPRRSRGGRSASGGSDTSSSYQSMTSPVSPSARTRTLYDGASTTGYGGATTTGYGAGSVTGYGGASTTGYGGVSTTGYGGISTTGYGDTLTCGTIFGRRTHSSAASSSSENDYGDATYSALGESVRSSRVSGRLFPESETGTRLSRTSAIRHSTARSRTLSTPTASSEFLTAPSGSATSAAGDESSTTSRARGYTTASETTAHRPESTVGFTPRDRSRTPTRGTYRTGSSPARSTEGLERYGSSQFSGLTPPGSIMSPQTETQSVTPLRTLFTEERVTTTRYYAPGTPRSEAPSDNFETVASGLEYMLADSGSQYETASSGSHSRFVSVPGSSQSAYITASSGDEKSIYVTANAGPSTEYLTADGSPMTPRAISPSLSYGSRVISPAPSAGSRVRLPTPFAGSRVKSPTPSAGSRARSPTPSAGLDRLPHLPEAGLSHQPHQLEAYQQFLQRVIVLQRGQPFNCHLHIHSPRKNVVQARRQIDPIRLWDTYHPR